MNSLPPRIVERLTQSPFRGNLGSEMKTLGILDRMRALLRTRHDTIRTAPCVVRNTPYLVETRTCAGEMPFDAPTAPRMIRRHEPTDKRATTAAGLSQTIRAARVTIKFIVSPFARYPSGPPFRRREYGAQ